MSTNTQALREALEASVKALWALAHACEKNPVYKEAYDALSELTPKLRAALSQPPAPEQAMPEAGVRQWPLIQLGAGKVEVGSGHHAYVPALIFGRNGTGVIGEATEPDRELKPGETLACVTFANVESLEVVQDHLNKVRAMLSASPAAPVAAKPEQQAQAGEPVAVSNAFGCDKEAAGGTLCADWCGGPQCPTSNTSPEVDSSTEAYKAYADNLPGAHDHLTDGARKRLEEAANFCLSPRPNFEPKRNRGSDDGYYEHAEASRLWWAFAAGMNYEEKRTREAITKKDAALRACVETFKWLIEQAGGPVCEHGAGVCFCRELAAITQAEQALGRSAL